MKKATFSSFISRNFAFSSALLDFISLFFACIFFIYTRFKKIPPPGIKKERLGRSFLRKVVVDNQGERWYNYPLVIKVIFVCDKCHYIFSRATEPEQCPDCGKYAARPANEAERQEYEEHLREFQGS